jgi:hypothetical protein
MPDIYGYKRNPKPSGVVSTEESILTIGGGMGPPNPAFNGLMIQNWQVQYQQDVQELFELGSSALYWVKSRPQGQGTIARVVGPGGAELLPKEAYDICKGGVQFVIAARTGACEGTAFESKHITMDGVLVTNIGYNMSVQDTLLQESVSFRFAWMDVTST